MIYVEWRDNMSVGNTEMDEHNKKFIGMINKIHDSLSRGNAPLVIPEILLELRNYAGYHFDFEETLMKSGNYPEYQRHNQEHITFISEVVDMYYKYYFCPCGDDLGYEVLNFLNEWFTKHITGTDKKLAQFLGRN
ncbi:MAG: hemerythrin family protein [Nitrospirae bacterium]|nr:hemerythrin family protein [Nitrospirota bacterium]